MILKSARRSDRIWYLTVHRKYLPLWTVTAHCARILIITPLMHGHPIKSPLAIFELRLPGIQDLRSDPMFILQNRTYQFVESDRTVSISQGSAPTPEN